MPARADEGSHADGHQPLTTADDGDLVRVHDPDVHDRDTGPFAHDHMCFDKVPHNENSLQLR